MASVLNTGYAVYQNNHHIQIPFVHLLTDPSLFAGDPFVATLSSYCSVLWRLVAWSARGIPLEPLLLGLFLAGRVLTIHAAGTVARALLPASRLAPAAAMALFALAPDPPIGGGTMVTNYLEQTSLSIPFFLFAMAAFYRRAPVLWAIYLALGFNLNPMYGIYAGTFFLAAFLSDPQFRASWRQWLIAVLLFVALAAPGAIWCLSAFGRPESDPQIWLMAAEARFPHHLFPLTWPVRHFVAFAAFSGALIAAWWNTPAADGRIGRHMVAWTAVAWSWLACAFVAAYAVHSPALLVLHPARGVDLWHAFAGIAIVSAAALRLEAATSARDDPGRHQMWSAWAPVLSLVTVAVVCLTSAGAYLIVAIAVLAYAVTRAPREPRQTGRWVSKSRLAVLLAVWVLIVGAGETVGRGVRRGLSGALVTRPDPEIVELARWARAHTPVDAMFLVEPDDAGSLFRVLARRPVFVTWKDGSAMLWDRTFARVWAERMELLGANLLATERCADARPEILGALSAGYTTMTDDRAATLATEFGLRYWVVRSDRSSEYSRAFATGRYAILALPVPQ